LSAKSPQLTIVRSYTEAFSFESKFAEMFNDSELILTVNDAIRTPAPRLTGKSPHRR
jgi:hypothetical protein